jgi:hypothetical protein
MSDESELGDPIGQVFHPDDEVARFVVVMSMARNDVKRGLEDLKSARVRVAPDISYRARLIVGHLVEGMDALDAYSQAFNVIPTFLRSMTPEGRGALKTARRELEQVGRHVFEHARNHTFHYPSPRRHHDADADLRTVLGAMGDQSTDVHGDGDTQVITLTFADHVALHLALGRYVENADDPARQAAAIETAARAFVEWADLLVIAFMDTNGMTFGKPLVSDKPKASAD